MGTGSQAGWRGAVVIDDWALVRLGIRTVLADRGVALLGEAEVAREGIRVAAQRGADLVVVGSVGDLAQGAAVRAAKRLPQAPSVVALVGRADAGELAGLLGSGVDGLLLRSTGAEELGGAFQRLQAGERVVGPALAPLLLGAVDLAADGAERHRAGPLTVKELEVLARVAEGAPNRAVASALHITPATVKTHLEHIYEKLGVSSRQDAVVRAVALGLLR